jgi:hypothetical protein
MLKICFFAPCYHVSQYRMWKRQFHRIVWSAFSLTSRTFATAIILIIVSSVAATPTVFSSASAQSSGGFFNQQPLQTVAGNYTNSDARMQIMLPDNWTGSVFENRNNTLTTIRVVPNGIPQSGQGFRTPDSMVIRIVNKDMASGSNSTSPFTMTGQSGQNRNFQFRSNTTNFQNRTSTTCTPSTPQPITINGMSGIIFSGDCSSPNFTFKYKSYAFQTLNKAFQISLMSSSSADFDKYMPAFDKSVNTLQIADTIQAPTVVTPEYPIAIVGVVLAMAVGSVLVIMRTRNSRMSWQT